MTAQEVEKLTNSQVKQASAIPTKTELAARILEKVKSLLPEENPPQINEARQIFKFERVIAAVFDECNRDDLPEALEIAIVEIALNQLDAVNAAVSSEGVAAFDGRLKKIKMNEVEYELDTEGNAAVEQGADYIFAQLQPKLKLYRRIKSL